MVITSSSPSSFAGVSVCVLVLINLDTRRRHYFCNDNNFLDIKVFLSCWQKSCVICSKFYSVQKAIPPEFDRIKRTAVFISRIIEHVFVYVKSNFVIRPYSYGGRIMSAYNENLSGRLEGFENIKGSRWNC